jgi:hypothetical protein
MDSTPKLTPTSVARIAEAEVAVRGTYFDHGDPDEEVESALFTWFASFRPLGWTKSAASGIVRILQHKENHRCRLLMRNKDATALVLNHYILPGMELSFTENSNEVCFTSKNYANPDAPEKNQWLLRFREQEPYDNFRQAYNEALQANDALRQIGRAPN